jgi:uroporphyrinogen decarboxylase
MNSRERVQAAIHKQPVDRVPVFLWFHPETASRLSRLLKIPPQYVGDAMGNDVHQTWVNNNLAMEGIVHEKDGDRHVDDWGITWERQYGFNQIVGFPLSSASPEAVLDFRFPYPAVEDLFGPMRLLADSSRDYFLGCDVSPCAFEMYWRLRGMENALLDMIEAPDLSREMFRRCVDFSIYLAEKAIRELSLDWLWTGDDVASQQGMLVSPKLWRSQIKPELERVFAVGKAHNLWVAYHCCGALRPIIPDLIEIGLDVLNPVQSNCPGMNPYELKKEFGDRLAFMGGVDTQYLLPRGTSLQVCWAIEALINAMTADGGGYILAASHTIPPETPDENIFGMLHVAGITREMIFDKAAQIRNERSAGC